MSTYYELPVKNKPGIKSRHVASCNAKLGRRCVCKERLRFVARAWDPEARDGKGGTIAKVFRVLDHAVTWKDERDRRRRHGVSVSPGRRGVTMDDVVEHFVKAAKDNRILNRRRVPYSMDSLRGIEEVARNGWPALREREARSITESDVEAVAGDLMAANKSASRVRNVVNTLRMLLKYAARHGLIEKAPRTDQVILPRLPSSRKRAPELSVALKLIAAVPEEDRVAWALFALAGDRLMEALTTTVEDVYFDEGLIRVPGTKSDHADRLAPLIAPLRGVIRTDLVRSGIRSGLLLPPRYATSQRGFLSPEALRERAYKAWNDRRLPRFEPHEFRHGYDTWLMRAGVPDQIRRVIVGHGRDRLDATYVHVSKDDIRAAGRRLEQHIEQQAGTSVSHRESHGPSESRVGEGIS